MEVKTPPTNVGDRYAYDIGILLYKWHRIIVKMELVLARADMG
jgi:hypothetical protein